MVTLGAHASDAGKLDVSEAKNGFFVPWPEGFEATEVGEKLRREVRKIRDIQVGTTTKVALLVDEVERTVVFVDLLAELIEVFAINLDAGGASVTAATNDRIFSVAKGVSEVEVAETAA